MALGGYLEVNTLYSQQDGASEGLSFQARRLTLFMSASIARRIKFLSEIEFEDGTKEIAIEFAAADIAFHPALNLRAGIMMNPIGGFNQNHDGPKWEFVERPDEAVNLLPATWSNAGFGFYGKANSRGWIFGYEVYLTNGFDGAIIDNEENKTFLPASKDNADRFEENSSGKPLITAKASVRNRKIGEVGLSYMGGVYNKTLEDGLETDEPRRVDVFAFDFNTTISGTGTYIFAEAAYVMADIPPSYLPQYGEAQWGSFLDVVQPVLRRKIFGWDDAVVNVAGRFDYVDWNTGNFGEDGGSMGDELMALTPAISFRPVPQTVLRLNYRYELTRDILRNPPSREASWLFGLSTYF